MQFEDERKTNNYSVAYCNPQIISQIEHSFRLTKDVRDKVEAATTDEAKEQIKEKRTMLERIRWRSIYHESLGNGRIKITSCVTMLSSKFFLQTIRTVLPN
jgi:hypothetical protein